MISYERLAAPSEHLGLLVEPGPDALRAALADPNFERFAEVQVLGRPLGDWRRDLRAQLGLGTPVVATGHQIEFVHAGVFAKTIAADVLAQHAGGSAVFIAVDSDLPKTDRLTVPEITAAGLRSVDVELPGCDLQRTVEAQPLVVRRHWLDFFVRIASLYEHYEQSALRTFADGWLETEAEEIDFRDGHDRAYAALEGALGLTTIRRVRLSALAETPAYRAFVHHLILNASQIAQAYNAAQASFRRRHHVRTPSRPVPPLHISEQRVELPFWASRAEGTRERLFVAAHNDAVELFADRTSLGVFDKAQFTAAQSPWDAAGWLVRPRALALSAFMRLFISDLFIHGIGGAKYDEVTEELVREFFGTDAPPLACISATVHLPLPRTNVDRAAVLAAEWRRRDLRFNPDRYISDVPADLLNRRDDLIERSDHLRQRHPKDRAARRQVYLDIREVNKRILERDPWLPARFEQDVEQLERQRRLNKVALQREYFVGLHTRSTLEQLVARTRELVIPD